MRILIVGAGVGGLALAAHLRQAGLQPLVVERAAEWHQPAYVISLWSNALATLEPLGFAARIAGVGVRPTGEVIRDHTGKIVKRLDYGEVIARHGPLVLLHRADLHRALRELAADVPVRLGVAPERLEQGDNGVEVTFTDGTRATFDAVVGADGTHSAVRELAFGAQEATYSGITSWIYMMPPVAPFPAEINDLFGHGSYCAAIPYGGETLCLCFMLKGPARHPDPPGERIATLRALFRAFGWIVPRALDSMHDPREIAHADIYELRATRWCAGRIALLGDAVHTYIPGFGAAMALEDASVLAAELAQATPDTVAEALAAYHERRHQRASHIRHSAEFLEQFSLISNPLGVWLRDTLLRATPDTLVTRSLEDNL
jgi:2-polyprenyl-6-methoxyphenol hydroxylase-like FAD-dependent oxidoreductase